MDIKICDTSSNPRHLGQHLVVQQAKGKNFSKRVFPSSLRTRNEFRSCKFAPQCRARNAVVLEVRVKAVEGNQCWCPPLSVELMAIQ